MAGGLAGFASREWGPWVSRGVGLNGSLVAHQSLGRKQLTPDGGTTLMTLCVMLARENPSSPRGPCLKLWGVSESWGGMEDVGGGAYAR